MFGLKKKKKNVPEQNAAPVTNQAPVEEAKPEKSAKHKKTFAPKFGSADSFTEAYLTGEEHVTIGRCGEETVGVTAIDPPADNIVVINDNPDSVMRQCVMPTVLQGKLSYVVYDPDGVYHEQLAGRMRLRGYDIQVVDLSDAEHSSRIDLFEIANITKNPYWVSVILSGSLKCNRQEIPVAHNLLMAMMQYLLAKKNRIYVNDMAELLDKVISIDTTVLKEMHDCPASKEAILNVAKASHNLLLVIAKRLKKFFFDGAVHKAKNPNIFTVTSHKKQTVTFVKKVPAEYRYLTTAMLFNLKASSIVCGAGDVSTLIIDTSADAWYNRALLSKVTAEAGSAMDKGVGYMAIRPNASGTLEPNKHQILIYMHSDDQVTKDYVYGYLKVGGTSAVQKQEGMSQFFRGKDAIENAMNAAPISLSELDSLKDCIVIDTSGAVRPFRCDRLA